MFNKYDKIDNSKLKIPFYLETPPDAFYPHDTETMVYDKNLHYYFLTEKGLSQYHVDFDPSETKRLIRTATMHIYSYIALMAQTSVNVMNYRIAKSLLGRHKSKKDGRLEFERMLATQAEFVSDFGDAKKTPKIVVNPDSGRMRDQSVDKSDGFWLHDEVLDWLNANYLTDPNVAFRPWEIDWSEY